MYYKNINFIADVSYDFNKLPLVFKISVKKTSHRK